MMHDIEETIALLARTPGALRALLRGLPDAWLAAREADGSWNAVEIVGHLIHGERTDWMTRVEATLRHGESIPFAPFDREGHLREMEGKSLEDLLEEFAHVRGENLARLRELDLQPADLERRGRHPDFGSVTLSQLLATWAVHDLTHLHQISRVFASRSRDMVGPWRKYLGVLHCSGHGA